MKIDLHVHSKERSACGRASEEQQIRAAIAAGLDAIMFTDHHALVPPEHLTELNDKFTPFRIFGGVEVTCDEEDFIILGVHDSAVASPDWHYADLHALVRKEAGFIALAHPFRYRDRVNPALEQFRPDAVEIHSNNIAERLEERIGEMAARWGVPTLSDSDAHKADVVGRFYNVLERPPTDEANLIAMLKAGQFVGAAAERHKRWFF